MIMNTLRRRIATCHLCRFVDKPFISHRVYAWLPEKTHTLAIGESPPPGRKAGSLYNLDTFDRLRLSLKFILGIKGDKRVLEALRKQGVFITAAVKCRPPNRDSLKEMRKKCVKHLRAEISLLQPKRIVAMGRMASASICEIFNLEQPRSVRYPTKLEAKRTEIFFLPHPNYIFRFARELAPVLRRLFRVS